MKFKIKNKVTYDNYLNKYVVEIRTMYGDADGYGEVIVGGFKKDQDEHLLQDLIETCDLMDATYPHGRGGGDNYNDVEGFNRWFNIDCLSKEEWDALSPYEQELYGEWEYEPDGYGTQASYYGYAIYYYDEQGFKYEVEVTK